MTSFGPDIRSRTLGRYRIHAVQAGGQKLDGGAMFGVVPKPLWERRIPADDRNRIQLGMRCLLVEHEDGLVLLDTGLGNKENAKFRDIYGVENAGADDRTWLEDALVSLGYAPQDIRLVINTHLHFDHAGGNTRADGAGAVQPSFPAARYVVQRGELDYATHTNERTGASYFAHNWDVLAARGQLDLIEGERDVVPGIRVIRTPGHVPHHQSVVIDGGQGAIACFLGDVCPTVAHLPLPWIMGYDVDPLTTLESKRGLLHRAADERWLLIFEHDADRAWGYAVHDGKAYQLTDPDAAAATS
ncbi:MAG: MBL fold metallo-hydrolase [Gemmatimonadaceae bacterium]